ncbi:hypothetical protein [Saccharicrinis aurantiacus]|uniref:hypothetical protein n=1 Tax=Saccharicrinis aurantiacus TaxID=1849719 RepID=UPI002493331A|nr:hypothetical protein [Saccharicrinis aurantiacus]
MKLIRYIRLMVLLLITVSIYSCAEEDINLVIVEPTIIEGVRLFYNVQNQDMSNLGWEEKEKDISFLSCEGTLCYEVIKGEYSGDNGVFISEMIIHLDNQETADTMLKMLEIELLKGMDDPQLNHTYKEGLHTYIRGVERFEVVTSESKTSIVITPVVNLIQALH